MMQWVRMPASFRRLLRSSPTRAPSAADSSLTREDGFLRMEITAKLEPPISHEEALAFMKENTGVRRMSV